MSKNDLKLFKKLYLNKRNSSIKTAMLVGLWSLTAFIKVLAKASK